MDEEGESPFEDIFDAKLWTGCCLYSVDTKPERRGDVPNLSRHNPYRSKPDVIYSRLHDNWIDNGDGDGHD